MIDARGLLVGFSLAFVFLTSTFDGAFQLWELLALSGVGFLGTYWCLGVDRVA